MNTPLFHLAQVLDTKQSTLSELSKGASAELRSLFFYQFLLLDDENFKKHLSILPKDIEFVLQSEHRKKIIYHYSPKDFPEIEKRCKTLGGKLGFDPSLQFRIESEWIDFFHETKNKPEVRQDWLAYLNGKKVKAPIFPKNTNHPTLLQIALTNNSDHETFAFLIGGLKKWNMGSQFTNLIRSVFKHERFDVLELLFENQSIRHAFTQANGARRKYTSPEDDLFYQKFQTFLNNVHELSSQNIDKVAQIYVKHLFNPSRGEHFQMFSEISKKTSAHRMHQLSERCLQSVLPCMENAVLRHQTKRNLKEEEPSIKKRNAL